MELAFAGVHQLCAPLLDHLDAAGAAARGAQRGLRPRGRADPDRFLVGLAVLSLMAAAADDQPLLCIVDDAQWLDQVSVQTLGFVARRLMAEPVAMIFAVRTAAATCWPGCRNQGRRTLRRRRSGVARIGRAGRIDERVRDRIVAETRGVPLALLEVPRNVSAAELAGGFGIAGRGRRRRQIEGGFIRRIQALPEPTRRLLLVAAAEPVGDAALFLRAAAAAGHPRRCARPRRGCRRHRIRKAHAVSASVDALGGVPRGRPLRAQSHPSGVGRRDRSGVRPRPSGMARRQRRGGARRRVAAELEASAGRAQSRGGVSAAATFLERAAVLTADPGAARRQGHRRRAGQAGRPRRPRRPTNSWRSPNWRRCRRFSMRRSARMRAQMEFVRSRGGEPGALPTGEAAAQLLSAAGDSRGSTTTWRARHTSRRSPQPCTRVGSAHRGCWRRWPRRPAAQRSTGRRNCGGRSTSC